MGSDCREITLVELEAQTRDAHQAYLDALDIWDQALTRQATAITRGPASSVAKLAAASLTAQVEKERKRVSFRDLFDQLGYLLDRTTTPR